MATRDPTDTKTALQRRGKPRELHPSIDDSDEPTELDATSARAPKSKSVKSTGDVTEFRESLGAPLKTDMLYRRVVASAQQAFEFNERFDSSGFASASGAVEVAYGKLRVVAVVSALEKMHAWVSERSESFTMEVQGRFLARRRPDHILVDDFLPLPSFCQSLAYETEGPEDRKKRFGNAKMRTISPDDWKPHETRVYEELGVFSPSHEIRFDPLKVQIPFHSHYTRSLYQKGPSPGDYDHLHHMKWLYTPVTGLNVLYSGITPFQVELPHRFKPVAVADGDSGHNPADCRVVARFEGGTVSAGIPLDDEGLVIGRDAACALPVPDASLSRRHTRLFFNEDGLLMVEDLTSKNGTQLDGKRITTPTAIRRPTTITLGDVDVDVRF